MTIRFNFNKRFIVNGKVYKSIEEMPEDIRQAFLNTLANTLFMAGRILPLLLRNRLGRQM